MRFITLYKNKRKCHLTDTELKKQEKIYNYSELRQDMKKILNLPRFVVVPVVIGALGVTSKRLKDWLKKLDVKIIIELIAKSSIAWNCKNCKASPRGLRLLCATCSLGNVEELPTKPR